jgi:hypothetical protein
MILLPTTHIYFEDNLKAKYYLLQLSQLTDEINKNIIEKKWDILQVFPRSHEQRQYVALRANYIFNIKKYAADHLGHSYDKKFSQVFDKLVLMLGVGLVFLKYHNPQTSLVIPLVLSLCIYNVVKFFSKSALIKVQNRALDQLLDKTYLRVSTKAFKLDDCSICLEPIKTNQLLGGHYPANATAHVFHKHCLGPLIKQTHDKSYFSCPLCRDYIWLQLHPSKGANE